MSLTEDMISKMISKIKEKSEPLKSQLVGLLKQHIDIHLADDKYSMVTNKIAYHSHEKLKNLYSEAIQIMSGKNDKNDENVDKLNEFFTNEELNSEEYKNVTSSTLLPTHLWLSLFEKAPFIYG